MCAPEGFGSEEGNRRPDPPTTPRLRPAAAKINKVVHGGLLPVRPNPLLGQRTPRQASARTEPYRETAPRLYFSGQGDALPQMLILALDLHAGEGITLELRSPEGSRLRPQAPVATPSPSALREPEDDRRRPTSQLP